MIGLDFSATTEAVLALAILVGMFVMFLREVYPVEVVAIGGAVVMLVLGILPMDDVTGVLSNNAPWTIAAMFIIVGALVRTGALDTVTQLATRNVVARPATTLVLLGVGVTGMSAFVNNTPSGRRDDADLHPVGQAIAACPLEGPDPVELHDDPGRDDYPGRHVDQPCRRWRRAVQGAGRVRYFRADPDRAAGRRGRPHLSCAVFQASAARAAVDGDIARRPQGDEVLHRGRGARRLADHRAQARGRAAVQAGRRAGRST